MGSERDVACGPEFIGRVGGGRTFAADSAGDDAGPGAPALRSAAFRISSLSIYVSGHHVRRASMEVLRHVETHSKRLRQAHAITHSTQSSFPSPKVCQTFFSSSVRPVTVIRVPPPFSGGFFEILPNCHQLLSTAMDYEITLRHHSLRLFAAESDDQHKQSKTLSKIRRLDLVSKFDTEGYRPSLRSYRSGS